MTSLLDMVKQADLRLNFTEVLRSPTSYERMERSVLQPRLLLYLHGLGTNAGLQRMAGLDSGTTLRDFAYVRRRYLSVEQQILTRPIDWEHVNPYGRFELDMSTRLALF